MFQGKLTWQISKESSVKINATEYYYNMVKYAILLY